MMRPHKEARLTRHSKCGRMESRLGRTPHMKRFEYNGQKFELPQIFCTYCKEWWVSDEMVAERTARIEAASDLKKASQGASGSEVSAGGMLALRKIPGSVPKQDPL